MGSRGNREQAAAHQPLLSSLVVRLTDSERTADFESGEDNRNSRSTRFYHDPPGCRVHAVSVSPARRTNRDHFNSPFHHSDEMPHRGRGQWRESVKYHETPPRFNRGRGVARSIGSGYAGHGLLSGPFRGETSGNSNPNVPPMEGDWYCSDPARNEANQIENI